MSSEDRLPIMAGCLLALLLQSSPAPAADPPAPASACVAVDYHALDFWIGRWRVETPKGEPAGESRVESVLSGCALLEHWRGLFLTTHQVQEGLGVHRYDAATRQWRQAWTDETGSTTDSTGTQEGSGIVYRETDPKTGTRTRMTLSPLPDGRVEQKGERWDDEAKAWKTTFHLLYFPVT